MSHSARSRVPAQMCPDQPQSVRSKLKTLAAALDAAQPPAVWAWGSSLRAGPVSWKPCARGGRLRLSRGSCARTVFHTPCDASSRFFLRILKLDRHCCRERIPANVFPIVSLGVVTRGQHVVEPSAHSPVSDLNFLIRRFFLHDRALA
jgi:hypothetical protein